MCSTFNEDKIEFDWKIQTIPTILFKSTKLSVQ